MSRSNLFYTFIALAVVFVLGAVYYAIPGIHHVLAPHNPNATQVKHVIGLIGIAVICVLVALVNRPKAESTENTTTTEAK